MLKSLFYFLTYKFWKVIIKIWKKVCKTRVENFLINRTKKSPNFISQFIYFDCYETYEKTVVCYNFPWMKSFGSVLRYNQRGKSLPNAVFTTRKSRIGEMENESILSRSRYDGLNFNKIQNVLHLLFYDFYPNEFLIENFFSKQFYRFHEVLGRSLNESYT